MTSIKTSIKTAVLALSFAVLCLTALAPTAAAEETSPCPSGPEYHYVSRDPRICLVILYFCDEGQEPFFHPQCGCGCRDIFSTSITTSVARTWDGLWRSLEEPAATACQTAVGTDRASG